MRKGEWHIVLDHLDRWCTVFTLCWTVLGTSSCSPSPTAVRGQSDEDRVDRVLADTPIAHAIVVGPWQRSRVPAALGLCLGIAVTAIGQVVVVGSCVVRPQLSIRCR